MSRISLHIKSIGDLGFGYGLNKLKKIFFFLPSPAISRFDAGGWSGILIGLYFTQYYFTLAIAYCNDDDINDEDIIY